MSRVFLETPHDDGLEIGWNVSARSHQRRHRLFLVSGQLLGLTGLRFTEVLAEIRKERCGGRQPGALAQRSRVSMEYERLCCPFRRPWRGNSKRDSALRAES